MAMASSRRNDRGRRPAASGVVMRNEAATHEVEVSRALNQWAVTVTSLADNRMITLQVFGPPPTCTFGAQPNLSLATNYQDLWWAAPAGSEAGWGVSFAHQGDIIFATWFTYDHDRRPMWLSAAAQKVAARVYRGTIFRTSQSGSMVGAPFFLGPGKPSTFWKYDSAAIARTPAGALTLTFADGNSAAFTYTVDAVTQTKQITRQVFRAPGTVCR